MQLTNGRSLDGTIIGELSIKLKKSMARLLGLFIVILCNTSLNHDVSLIYLQIQVIRALAILKKAAADANREFGLDEKLADHIIKAAEEVCKYVLSL